MASKVGSLLVDVGLDVAQIKQDVGKATRELSQFRQKVDRQMGKMQRSFRKATQGVKGLVAVLGAQQLGSAIGRTLKSFEEINRQARSLGASRENIQELQFAFRQFGLEQKDVTDALATVSDRADDALGGMQSFIDDFERFGIEVDSLRGKSPGELFRTVAQGISELDSEQKQVTAAVRLFGDEVGQRLLPLLNEGASGIDKYAQRARELGVVVSDELVKDSAKAAKDFRALNEVLTAKFASAVAQNAESFSTLAEAMTSVAIQASKAAASVVELAAASTAEIFGPDNQDTLGELNRLREQQNELLEDRVRLQNKIKESDEPAVTQILKKELQEVNQELERTNNRMIALGRAAQQSSSGGSDTTLDPITVTGDTGSSGSSSVLLGRVGRRGRGQSSYLQDMIEIQNQTQEATEKTNREYKESQQLLKRIDQQAKSMKEQGNGLGFAFKSAFEDAIIEGKKFSDVLRGLAEDISRLILRRNVTEPLANSIGSIDFSSMFSSSSSSMGTGTGSSPAMASGRAAGGPVKQNETYMVGENGPELFTPGRSGGITPNNRMGGGDVTVNVVNEGGGDAEVSERSDGRGGSVIDVFIPMVASGIQQGKLDSALTKRFQGIKPRTAGRG